MSNAMKVYIFSFFQMALVIIPVIVPYYQSLGLTMADIFKLQGLFGLSVVICEIPTGYVADLWGRKKTLLVGAFLVGVGFTYLIFARSFAQLVGTEVILGMGFSLISGADVSLLYDSVALDNKESRKKVLSNKQFAELTGEATAAIFGGLLVLKSFQTVLIANTVVFWVPFLVALTFHEISYVKLDTKSHGKNFQKIIAHLFSKKDPILRLGFLNNILWGLSTVMGVWMLQRYWQAQNIDLKYFGVLWAAFNLTAAFTGKIAHNLERHIGPVSLLVAIGCAPIAGYLGMVMWPNAFGVACGAFFYVGRGFNYVMLKDIVNWRTPSSIRTTVNSAQSFCFRLGFAIFGPLVGLGVDRFGMNRALSLLAAIFTVFFFAAMLPLINTIRKTSIDYIPEIPLID